MYVKICSLTIALALCNQLLHGQPTLSTMSKDTIVARSELLSTTYLLNGKKLNLPVMQWFMSDYPEAHDNIRVSALSNQISLAGFSVGALFGFTGLLIFNQNERVGSDMLKVGAVGMGTGVAFHLISASYKRRAVRNYNRAVKKLYHASGASYFRFEQNGLGARFAFVF